MSLRTKANEIKAVGESQRGNFTPTGVPLKMYNYWLNTSHSATARAISLGVRKENFCHFWRVVAIWAPLEWAVETTVNFFSTKTGIVVGVASYVLLSVLLTAAIGLGFLVGMVIVPLAVAYAVAGLVSGALVVTKDFDSDDDERWIRRTAWICLPFSAIAYGVGKVGQFLKAHWTTKASEVLAYGFFGLAGLLLLTLVVLFTAELGWWFPFAVAGFIGMVVGAVYVIGFLADYANGRREVKKQELRAARIEADHDGVAFVPPAPGLLKRLWSGVVDFAILAAQVARVKKWKICPIVEVNNDN